METPGPALRQAAVRKRLKGVLAVPDRFAGYARAAGVSRAGGDFKSADKDLLRARLIAPADPRLLMNTANLWLSSGLAGDPLGALQGALCLEPEFTPAADRLVLLWKASGNIPGAINVARWNTCRNPGMRTAALLELTLLAFDGDDPVRARAGLEQALVEIVRSGVNPQALIRLAKTVGGFELQFRVLRVLLCASPIHEVAGQELASTPVEDEAQWPSREVLSRLRFALPTNSIIQNGAGVFLEHNDRAGEAPGRYTMAAVLDPGQSVSIFNLGVQARYAGDFPRAVRLFERAMVVSPGDPIYRYNLGLTALAISDDARGLELYEERWRSGERQSHRRGGGSPSFPQPFWDGEEAIEVDDSILVWGEQGLGDEIWFAGFVPGLDAKDRVILECDERLKTLFARSGLARTVVGRVDPPHPEASGARRQAAAGSLPFLVRRRSPNPGGVKPQGYLRVDQARAAGLRERLDSVADGPTIGVSWRSRKPNPAQSFEAPLRHWKPIFELPKATFVNLQYDATKEELNQIRARTGIQLVALDDIDPFHDIDGLATLISVLDHVVSIANVNVTLCNGIGRDCHVALRFYQEDWRFQRDQPDSHWLPTCKMYWPNREADWDHVFQRISVSIAEDPGFGLSVRKDISN
jgi:hypothetical protein